VGRLLIDSAGRWIARVTDLAAMVINVNQPAVRPA
jgi:hypothetical protein